MQQFLRLVVYRFELGEKKTLHRVGRYRLWKKFGYDMEPILFRWMLLSRVQLWRALIPTVLVQAGFEYIRSCVLSNSSFGTWRYSNKRPMHEKRMNTKGEKYRQQENLTQAHWSPFLVLQTDRKMEMHTLHPVQRR